MPVQISHHTAHYYCRDAVKVDRCDPKLLLFSNTNAVELVLCRLTSRNTSISCLSTEGPCIFCLSTKGQSIAIHLSLVYPRKARLSQHIHLLSIHGRPIYCNTSISCISTKGPSISQHIYLLSIHGRPVYRNTSISCLSTKGPSIATHLSLAYPQKAHLSQHMYNANHNVVVYSFLHIELAHCIYELTENNN